MLTGIVLASAAAQLAVAAFALAARGRPAVSALVYGTSSVICLALLVAMLAGAGWNNLTLPLGLPWIGAHFTVDALSAFFLVIVNLGGAIAGLYAIGYGKHESAPHRILPFYPAFLAGMNLVLVAGDAFTFLVSWEFMSLASWALVMAHHRERDNAFAGYVYLVMASAGTLALLLAFGLLAGASGDYTFDAIRQNHLTPIFAALVLTLALIGAGSKAGIVPLHVWLPLAHPAAPSHVSALMSGVMTKVAIYGVIRIVFDLVGPPQYWWSIVLLALGGVTAVLGILQAMLQDDMKRLLAYSTVENVGIIFIGLGLALAFGANGMTAAAALAMTAALFHALNHSFFKSLLFFGAGAVLTATGERSIERLGGLIHRMPAAALFFLAGCVAISALPPFNGFVSEWLVLQAVLVSPDLPEWGLRILVPATGAMLALAAALAAACFVRLYGVAFLGRPRSTHAASAGETDGFSLAAMGLLAALCLLAGVLPGVVIDSLGPVVSQLVGGRMPEQRAIEWLSIAPIGESRSSYNGLLVFIFIAVSAALAAFAIHRLASRALRRAPAWDGGFPDPNPATQYTGASFAQPIVRVYGTIIFEAREHVQIPAPGDLAPAHFALTLRDFVWDELYRPIAIGVGAIADRLNRFQYLTVRRYLGLVFAALVLLLLLVAVWP